MPSITESSLAGGLQDFLQGLFIGSFSAILLSLMCFLFIKI